jgi:hypothetical protein
MHRRKLARRTVLLFAAAIALLAFAGPQRAQAIVIDFDDITTQTSCCVAVPTNYMGLTWGNEDAYWSVVSDTYYSFLGNEYGAPSHNNPQLEGYAAQNDGGTLVVTIADGENFDFVSAEFTGQGPEGIGTAVDIKVEGWNNDDPQNPQLVGWAYMSLPNTSYALLSQPINDIDELRFITSDVNLNGGDWWLMDNLTLNAPTLVPEPGTVFLMGSGLLGLAYQGRKRRA